MADVVLAEVKSAWYSKINWTQAIGAAASVLVLATGGSYNIPPEQQAIIVAVIQGIQSISTWVFRSWFNSSVPPSAVAK